MKIIYWMAFIFIFWAMIGYPLFLIFLSKIIHRKNNIDESLEPTVTIMIVAHNEEKVIEEKLQNVTSINYPREKLKILVTSDNSTDSTNSIVKKFIENTDYQVELYEVKNRKGKTNAQNEAQKLVKSEILVMTDANAILHENSVKELVSYFTDESIAYVCGQLQYVNTFENATANSESQYWNLELALRKIESNIQTITAGNGSLYAVRNDDYIVFDPIKSHDSSMPIYYALKNKRALYNSNAISYEKASEEITDEFNRKVRMNRVILGNILPDIKILNFIEYRWFTFFYLGHRTARYTLWINHLLLFLANIALRELHIIYKLTFYSHLICILLIIVYKYLNINNKFLNLLRHYFMTILAQWVGVIKTLAGKNKPFWNKAESTRK